MIYQQKPMGTRGIYETSLKVACCQRHGLCTSNAGRTADNPWRRLLWFFHEWSSCFDVNTTQSIYSLWLCSQVVSRLAYDGIYHGNLYKAICTWYFSGIYFPIGGLYAGDHLWLETDTLIEPVPSEKKYRNPSAPESYKLQKEVNTTLSRTIMFNPENAMVTAKRGKTGSEGSTTCHKWF